MRDGDTTTEWSYSELEDIAVNSNSGVCGDPGCDREPEIASSNGFFVELRCEEHVDEQKENISVLARKRDSDGTGIEIERTDCARCGGTGEVTKMVAGRSGVTRCPDCDNIPEYALPDEIPDDPHARIEEIEEELEALEQEEEELEKVRSNIRDAIGSLDAVARSDVVPEEKQTVLSHLSSQVSQVTRDIDDRHILHHREALRDEKRELEALINHLSELDSSSKNAAD